ncbi:hypothetical protein AAFF_G00359370 [Aldrovandia affinis]|uniref:Uncharacterized protein n=1 Tax=Aldrovandia affinis TaxID=143900 RepID=A0AAD7SI38_9TELE|nr:hypothetical protein AAFF_G00359370 [Aldrovandia affinis]
MPEVSLNDIVPHPSGAVFTWQGDVASQRRRARAERRERPAYSRRPGQVTEDKWNLSARAGPFWVWTDRKTTAAGLHDSPSAEGEQKARQRA